MAMSSKLRVGLLQNSMHVPAWAFQMLEQIKESDCTTIELIVLNGSPQKEQHRLTRLYRNRKQILTTLYLMLDRKLFKRKSYALDQKDASRMLADIPTLRVTPKQTRYSDRLTDEDIEKIRTYNIDVFIRLGFRILRGQILMVANYGVWSYHHGDNCINRGGPAGFWEVMEGHPVTGSMLQILTDDLDNGRVLCRSFSATDIISVTRNRNNYYWNSLSMVGRKLRELHREGPEVFFKKVDSSNSVPFFYDRRLYVSPNTAAFLRSFVHLMSRYVRFKLYHVLFFDQWVLMYSLGNGPASSLWRYKRITPPIDRFWADPHIVFKDDRYYIFIEEFIYSRNTGHVSVMEMGQNGVYTEPKTILERPYHLSYPFIFEWSGSYYLIPESMSNKTIEVYKCDCFPDQWSFHKTLFRDILAVDATLFQHERKWWLFVNVVENPGASSWDELHLYFADSPLSDTWTPHPQNPIVSDVRRSRPAGKLFVRDGVIYRPSQNSLKGQYGYGIKINKVTRLTTSEYEEIEVNSIEPLWDPRIKGVHTLNQVNRLTMVDGKLTRPKCFRWGSQ